MSYYTFRQFLKEKQENLDLQKMFNDYNRIFFDNKINPVKVEFVNGRKRGVRLGAYYQDDNRIIINSDYAGNENIIKNVLVHEMIHAYLGQNKERLTDKRAHGTDFKNMAKEMQKKDKDLIASLGDTMLNVMSLQDKGKEIIPIYFVGFSYQENANFTVREISDMAFCSYTDNIENIVQSRLDNGYNKVAFIFKVNMNTKNFDYELIKKVIDKNGNFTGKSINFWVSLIKKEKENVTFFKKMTKK